MNVIFGNDDHWGQAASAYHSFEYALFSIEVGILPFVPNVWNFYRIFSFLAN
jgi:hypothetical protein